MSNTGSKTPGVIHSELQQGITGMQTAWPSTQPSITVLTVTYTKDQMVQKLQTVDAPFQAVIDTRNAYKTAVSAQVEAQPTAEAFLAAFQAAIPQYLGPNNADLSKFGSKPKKARKQLTAEQKTQAAAKRAATRAARHTMGKNQKKAIKGVVPAPATPTTPAKPGP